MTASMYMYMCDLKKKYINNFNSLLIGIGDIGNFCFSTHFVYCYIYIFINLLT